MKPPNVVNATKYDGRTVNSIVRFAFRELEIDGSRVTVKVKHTKSSWGGRYYAKPWLSSTEVYDWARNDWKEIRVGADIPAGHSLIIARINPSPDRYPRTYTPYERKQGPEPWELGDWKEALITIVAHEAAHHKQFLVKARKRGRFNEVETEWAALRVWRRWRKR